jgi:hypothetical protein
MKKFDKKLIEFAKFCIKKNIYYVGRSMWQIKTDPDSAVTFISTKRLIKLFKKQK